MVFDPVATRLSDSAGHVPPYRARSTLRLLLGAGVLAVAACATPTAPPADTAAATKTETTVPSAKSAPVAAPAQATAEPASPTAPPAPVALSPQELQRTLAAAIEHLQAGQEDQAEAELGRVLQSEPNNRLAQSLIRQIKDDPMVMLGRESYAYRVQPGETLSRLAQRHLNDLHLFYILARYNQIKVPRTLAGGQLIRLPGKAPAAVATTAPLPAANPAPGATAPQPAAGGAATTTPGSSAQPSNPQPTAAANEAAAAARAAKARADAIARHSRAARAAFAKQDLDGALRAWDAVLEIEPENRTALLEKQKVQGLKEKLGKVK